jgi:hypothetical protein
MSNRIPDVSIVSFLPEVLQELENPVASANDPISINFHLNHSAQITIGFAMTGAATLVGVARAERFWTGGLLGRTTLTAVFFRLNSKVAAAD